MFVAKFSQQRQKFRRRNVDAAARLNRLDQNRADSVRGGKSRRNRIFDDRQGRPAFVGNVTKAAELAELRTERAAEMFAVRGVERAVAEAVIRAVKRDDAAFAGGEQGGLERGFDGFKTGIAENGFAGIGFCQLLQRSKVIRLNSLRQFGLERVRMHVAHRVQQFRHLFLPGFDDVWIRVAGGGDAERGGQIQILFPVGIPDVNALRAFPDNRPRAVRFDESDISRFEITKQLQIFRCPSQIQIWIYDLRTAVLPS